MHLNGRTATGPRHPRARRGAARAVRGGRPSGAWRLDRLVSDAGQQDPRGPAFVRKAWLSSPRYVPCQCRGEWHHLATEMVRGMTGRPVLLIVPDAARHLDPCLNHSERGSVGRNVNGGDNRHHHERAHHRRNHPAEHNGQRCRQRTHTGGRSSIWFADCHPLGLRFCRSLWSSRCSRQVGLSRMVAVFLIYSIRVKACSFALTCTRSTALSRASVRRELSNFDCRS